MCVHSWISSSFWWCSWYCGNKFLFSFVLHSALVFPSLEKRCNLRRRFMKGDPIQESPSEAPLESLPCKPLLRCLCAASHIWFLRPSLTPSLSEFPLSLGAWGKITPKLIFWWLNHLILFSKELKLESSINGLSSGKRFGASQDARVQNWFNSLPSMWAST